MRPDIFALAALLALSLPEATAALYKWVDEKGRVQYSDKPPDNKSGVQMSNQGVIVKKIEGGLTPEQKKAKDEEEARRKIEDAKAAEQRRQDNALLQSFTSVKEIDMKRDREIQALDVTIANLRSQEKSVADRTAEDRKRFEFYEKRKKPPPDSINEDIARGETERKILNEEIKRKLEEIAATRNKYEALKKRYIELKQEAGVMIQPAAAAMPTSSAKK